MDTPYDGLQNFLRNTDPFNFCCVEKLSEELDLSQTFLDCKLQRVTLLAKNSRPVGLSSVDIMALKRYDTANQSVNNKYVASHSVSNKNLIIKSNKLTSE